MTPRWIYGAPPVPLTDPLRRAFELLSTRLSPPPRRGFEGLPRAVTDASPHALVIGAGLGGIAAAIRLGARGYRVTVLDRLEGPGGRARVLTEGDFRFDAGPTIVTAPFLLEELWQMAGRRMSDDVTLVPVTPFYRIRFHDGATFDYSGDADSMRAEIERFEPRDVAGWQRFLAHSERIYEVGFEELGDQPFSSGFDMARIAPAMVRLESHRSVASLVARYIRDPRLRQVFSFHPLLIGGNPFRASSIYALIAHLERSHGVWFPRGGTGALVHAMVRLAEGLGVRFEYGAEVGRIVVEEGHARGVRLADGSRRDAALVVSNADSAWTLRHLIAARDRPSWPDRRIERARYSMSLFVWYFGTEGHYKDVPHHTILLGPRYRELLEDIFERKVLAEDFSLYLHRPTATDPSLAPDGHDAFYVLSPVPHLDAGIDWEQRAERYRRAIERVLEDSMLPGLRARVVSSRVLHPQHFHDDYLAYRGAAFGLEPVLEQSAYFRPHNESEDIRGLYFVGAGTHPGAGIPGVLSSARVLDRVVPEPSPRESS